jgi:hypothetical protein
MLECRAAIISMDPPSITKFAVARCGTPVTFTNSSLEICTRLSSFETTPDSMRPAETPTLPNRPAIATP